MALNVNLDITQLAQAFEAGILDTQKAIATSVLTELVLRTPIDVGDAKSNWVVGIDQEGSGPIPAHAPGKKGSTYNANNAFAINDGVAPIASTRLGQTINITNNLDYIEQLNNGTSLQAPAGFVEDAVEIGIRNIPNVTII